MKKMGSKSSIFTKAEFANHLRELSVKNELEFLSKLEEDRSWMHRIKSDAPKTNGERLLQDLRTRHDKLEAEYTELRKRKPAKRKKSTRFLFRSSENPSTEYASRRIPNPEEHLWRLEGGPRLELGSCFMTGKKSIDQLLDFSSNINNQLLRYTAEGGIQIWPDFPAAVEFDVSLRSGFGGGFKYGNFTVAAEAMFRLPPAPCQGRLKWSFYARCMNYGFRISGLGAIYVHLVNAVIENTNVPIPPISFNITGNLFRQILGTTYFHGAPLFLRGEFGVVEGQRSEIHSLVLVQSIATTGNVTAQGSVGFEAPPITSFGFPEGVRFTLGQPALPWWI